MTKPIAIYQDAISRVVRVRCAEPLGCSPDHGRPATSEPACRIKRFLPQLVRLADAVGPDHPELFHGALRRTVCVECGPGAAGDSCADREQGRCCVARYLPWLYVVIVRVHFGQPQRPDRAEASAMDSQKGV